jgi:hypothetical protein
LAGYTYSTFTTALATFLVVPVAQAEFVTALPMIIDGAEQWCYRDLDLLSTIEKDSSAALTAGSRNFSLPSSIGKFVTVEEINVISPAGQTDPDLGTRKPLLPATKEMLDTLYPSVTGSSVPQYFGMVKQDTIIVGPWPDAAYQVEVVGTVRPAALSASNTSTFLSQYLPDLFFAAAMVWGAGYIKDFGAAADDPKLAVTWKGIYDTSLKSAEIEEARKKFTSQGWSSKEPAPLATPPRT